MLDKEFKRINDGHSSISLCQETQKTAKDLTGFGYDTIEDIWRDLNDEIDELKVELDKNDKERISEELGDVVFVLCNLANQYGIDLGESVEYSTKEFQRRLLYINDRITDKYGANINNERNSLRNAFEKLDRKEVFRLWKEAKSSKN